MYHRTYTGKFIFNILCRIIVWTLHFFKVGILIWSSTVCTPFSGLQCFPVVSGLQYFPVVIGLQCVLYFLYLSSYCIFFVVINHLLDLFLSVYTCISLCAVGLGFEFLFSLIL